MQPKQPWKLLIDKESERQSERERNDTEAYRKDETCGRRGAERKSLAAFLLSDPL